MKVTVTVALDFDLDRICALSGLAADVATSELLETITATVREDWEREVEGYGDLVKVAAIATAVDPDRQ
jgi:hypothetical protein